MTTPAGVVELVDLQLAAVIGLGALAGLGGALVLLGRRPPARERTVMVRRWLGAGGQRLLVALAAGLVVLFITRWVVIGVAAVAVALLWDQLFGGARSERRSIERLEGLAAWTESLRDTIAGAVGLEQAIPATALAAAPSVSAPLGLLAGRLAVRVPLATALHRFADDLDDSAADLVVAALVLNSRLRGPGLRVVLSSLAVAIREELEVRRRIMAGRRSTRRSVQIVVGVSAAFVVLLSRFNPDYVEPYGTVTGQLVLVIVVLLFAVGFWWLRRLAQYDVPRRFLAGAGAPQQPQSAVRPL